MPRFDSIRASGAVNLSVVIGKEQSVQVTVDDNLIDLVKTETSGSTLVISTMQSYSTQLGLQVTVTTPEIKKLNLSGASEASLPGLSEPEFEIVVSGASNAKISGTADSLSVDSSGASSVKLGELKTNKASVVASGASSVTVNATHSVTANASGASTINILGDPEKVVESKSGASSINRK